MKFPPRKVVSFDEYYMGLCFLISCRSKDPSTQHGCVIVDKHNVPIGWGYNGSFRNINDYDLDWSSPEKYPYIIHAEHNAIDSVSGGNAVIENSTFYITGIPCLECAKKIANKRASRVMYGPRKSKMNLNTDHVEKIFDICGIKFEQFKGKLNWMDINVNLLKDQFKEFFIE